MLKTLLATFISLPTFAEIWFPASKPGLKGKSVKIWRYPRSCKLPNRLFELHATVDKTGRPQTTE